MIIRLTTLQISDHWEAIKDMLDKAVPEIPGQLANTNNNVLRSLITGESVCWIGYKKIAEKQNDIVCMLITRILSDDTTGIRSLLIYCLTGWDILDYDFYEEGIEILKKYQKEAGCHRIAFYSDESRILQIAERLGFNTEMRFGTLTT